jgi:dephospho-CoA kinase
MSQDPDESVEDKPRVIVLTGGIASGKSAVSDRFAELGVPVIDSDLIARELVQPGEPAYAEIVQAFSEDILTADGELDRPRMRERIFSDAASRKRLESILHPAIAERARERIRATRAPYCILVVPLLAETGFFSWADRVLLVDADEDAQVRRLTARDGVSRQQAEAALRAQAGRAERQALADDVIDNSGPIEQLDEAVRRLHADYLALAKGLRDGQTVGE